MLLSGELSDTIRTIGALESDHQTTEVLLTNGARGTYSGLLRETEIARVRVIDSVTRTTLMAGIDGISAVRGVDHPRLQRRVHTNTHSRPLVDREAVKSSGTTGAY